VALSTVTAKPITGEATPLPPAPTSAGARAEDAAPVATGASGAASPTSADPAPALAQAPAAAVAGPPAAKPPAAKPRPAARTVKPREAKPAALPPPAAPVAKGMVRIAVSPWGQIEIDGNAAGTTPPINELSLPEGRHQITIRNADFPPHTVTVNVTAGQPVTLKHRFGS
jgi:serine/threonine-protein kinase